MMKGEPLKAEEYVVETPPDDEPPMANGAAGQAATRVRWTVPPMIWRDPKDIPRRAFLYAHYYARGFTSATVAAGGIGKSLLKIVESLAMASGLPLLGIKPAERTRVLYWNGDDPFVEVERRIDAVAQHYGLDLKRLFDERWLYVGTQDNQPLCLAGMNGANATLNQNAITDVIDFIREHEIGLACFDPLKSVHRVPENSNDEMDVIGGAFNLIAERTNAAVGLDHHIRKIAFGQVDVTIADARGATALINKVRLSRVVNVMTPALAVQARIKEEDRVRYIRTDNGKGNIAPPIKATWYRIIPVLCANGQDSPTVTAWTFPNAFDEVTVDHMLRVRAMAAEGNYRKDSRAEDWIGHAVAEMLDLDIDDEADSKRIRQILRTWFENRVLTTKSRQDERRKTRVFVVPGDWNEGTYGEFGMGAPV